MVAKRVPASAAAQLAGIEPEKIRKRGAVLVVDSTTSSCARYMSEWYWIAIVLLLYFD
jgi:hypothetical protein